MEKMRTMLLMLLMMVMVIPSSVLGIKCYHCSTYGTGSTADCGEPFKSDNIKTCTADPELGKEPGCTKATYTIGGLLHSIVL